MTAPREAAPPAKHPVRCPSCGRATTTGPAYLLLCPDCAQRAEAPLRSLPQATACAGLCGGTALVWEDLPTAAGGSEQHLTPCPDCGAKRRQ